jgi:prepilin-type processing-associated H-X9-DG protein
MMSPTAHAPPSRRRGFTVVELLVVIGTISLLVGILMPALASARAQSRRVSCMSNVRQIAMACQMYAGEYKSWIGFTNGIDRKVLLYPYLQQGQTNADLNERDVWFCQANTLPETSASYGFNPYLNYKKFGLIKKWSETVTLGDAGINDLRDPILSTHMYPPSAQPGQALPPGPPTNSVAPAPDKIGRPNPRHPRKLANVGFVDGHVESMPMTAQSPFYPGEPGAWSGNNIGDPNDPNYKDTLWDLN